MKNPKGHSEEYLTVSQVAEILQVKPNTVREWIRTKKVSASRLPGNRNIYRISRTEIRAFIDQNRVK